MDKNFKIVWLNERGKASQQTVKGQVINEYFAAYLETGKGYRITHLPSGSCLTRAYFRTFEDAKGFADFVTYAFGGYLHHPGPDALKIAKDNVKDGLKIWALTFNVEDLPQPVTMEMVRSLLDGQARLTDSDIEQGTFIPGDQASGASEPVQVI